MSASKSTKGAAAGVPPVAAAKADDKAGAPAAAVKQPAPAAKPAAKPAARKPSRLEETKARNKKALADALALAKAVKLPPAPDLQPLPKPKAPAKPPKGRQPKLVRDTFTMPEPEYAQLARLKKRIAGLGGDVKKSELLRAGLGLLAALQNKELAAVMARVERVKTGRPKK